MRACVLTLTITGLWLCGLAHAQGGPPLLTDDPGTPGDRQWEINLAATTEKHDGTWDMELPDADLNYGLGEHIQLNFEMPWLVRTGEGAAQTEAGDGSVAVKWRVVDEEKRGLDVSIYPRLTYNSPGPRRLVERGSQFLLPVELARSYGKLSLNFEAGYNFRQDAQDEVTLGMAAGYEATHGLELLAELHTEALRSFHENESVFQVGGREKLSEHLVLLFAAGRAVFGSTADQPGFLAYAGLQLLLGHSSHHK
ncbi:MAG TPA: hypothetical protein VGF06_08595 [Terriglobales bacterium]|jgi:hypothetical protein